MCLDEGSSILEKHFIIKPGIPSSPTNLKGPRSKALRSFQDIQGKRGGKCRKITAKKKNRELAPPPQRIIINRFEVFWKIYYATTLD
jgi:hypothetical protein